MTKKIITILLNASAFILLAAAIILLVRGPKEAAAPQPEDSRPDDSVIQTMPSETDSKILPESLSLSAASEYIIVGRSQQAEAQVLPAEAAGTRIRWSSGDESVATVDENGLITAVGKGKTFITAVTDNGVSAYIPVSGIGEATFYFSPSSLKRDYPVGGTTDTEQCRRISEFCAEKLAVAGLESLICSDDELDFFGRAVEARDSGTDFFLMIRTGKDEKAKDPRIGFNLSQADAARMGLAIKDRLCAIVQTEGKGEILSNMDLPEEELGFPRKQKLPVIFIEVQNHTSPENAQWIIDEAKTIGYAIADGIMDSLSI